MYNYAILFSGEYQGEMVFETKAKALEAWDNISLVGNQWAELRQGSFFYTKWGTLLSHGKTYRLKQANSLRLPENFY